MSQVELAVDGDGVVNRREHRPAVVHHADDARAESLIVVDEIEVPETPGQEAARPQTEGERLGKAGRAHQRELEKVH